MAEERNVKEEDLRKTLEKSGIIISSEESQILLEFLYEMANIVLHQNLVESYEERRFVCKGQH